MSSCQHILKDKEILQEHSSTKILKELDTSGVPRVTANTVARSKILTMAAKIPTKNITTLLIIYFLFFFRRTAYALLHPRSAGHATRRRLHSPVHLLHPKRWFLPPPWQSVQGRSLSGRTCEWRRPWIFEEENNMYRMMYTVELVLFAVSLSLYQNKDQKIGLAMTCNKHGGIK